MKLFLENIIYRSILGGIIMLLSGGYVLGQSQKPYVIRNFQKQEYRAESQNWSVAIDQSAFVYIANNSGLLEFDGVEWSFYPSPAGSVMRSVAVDGKNRIFTSGYRELGYWEKSSYGDLEYTSLVPEAGALFDQNEEFWNTVIIGSTVYFHSFSSVFIYDGESFSVFRPGSIIHSVGSFNGQLVMHIAGLGLNVLENGVQKPLLSKPALSSSVVQFFASMPDSSLLIGTESDGLFLYSKEELHPYQEEWQAYFSEQKVNRGAVALNGDVVIGTLLDGVIVFDREGELLARINKEEGLQNNTVLGIKSGEDRGIWVSLDQGVDYISFMPDPSYSHEEFSETGAIYAAAIFGEEIYLSTNQGVFYRNLDSENDTFLFVPGTQGQAWSCDILDGQLLVSHNDGTFKIENHTATRISPVGGGFSITRNPLKDNVVVQSTYSNIVMYENNSGQWRYAGQLEGFNDLIRYIEIDHFNNLWASHMHRGIYRLKLNDSQDAILESQYIGDSVFGKDYDIQVFKIENRIVFTTGEKFYTYDDLSDRIIPFEALNNKLGEFASAHRVVSGYDHHYWLIGKNGIGLFRIQGSEVSTFRRYPRALFNEHLIDGYENILPLSATDGLLCLDNGYAILRAGRPELSTSFEERSLSLKSIRMGGRSGKGEKLHLEAEEFKIPYSRNSLNLRLAFPHYGSHTVRFESFIEGLDLEWSEAREIPEFDFTRMPYGNYTIRIRAFNEWDQRSLETQILLEVLPPWYLRRWSFALYTLLLLTLFIVGRFLVLRRIRKQEQLMQESQEKELVRLRNEKLNVELSFKSQELANSAMSIIKKNEFLLELKETLRAQKEDLGTRYPEKYYSRVVRKIDNNISSMDDWNVFEIHFEKAHEKFLQKLISKYPQLSHSDLRLCAYLRMNLSSKEIAPLLRISYRGVENHRYRLRKKLLLKKDVNLTDFILSL